MENLNAIVANNLSELRKKSGLTQQQLAKQFNYSDKTISKWELGYAIPSVDVLKDLATFYGVNIDYLVNKHETTADIEKKNIKEKDDKKILILLLLNSVFLLIATVIFVWTCLDSDSSPYWQIFIWGTSACFLLSSFFIWRIWKSNVIPWLVITSLFTWTIITAFYCTFLDDNIWYIYFVGIPVELCLIIISKMKEG